MKPGFALTLRHDGVALLQRAPTGWLLVGEVSLADPALDDALAALRTTASTLAPDGVATKVVLPESELLYTRIDVPGPDPEARRQAIRAALDGMTPYAVDDLAFDWSGSGKTLQVAVVARETLAEAAAFARSHGFNPVSFVACPELDQFLGEPFFGPAGDLPAGQRVERDVVPVKMVGRAERPEVAAKAIFGVKLPFGAKPRDDDTPPPPDKPEPQVPSRNAAAAHMAAAARTSGPSPDPEREPEQSPGDENEDAATVVAFSTRRAPSALPPQPPAAATDPADASDPAPAPSDSAVAVAAPAETARTEPTLSEGDTKAARRARKSARRADPPRPVPPLAASGSAAPAGAVAKPSRLAGVAERMPERAASQPLEPKRTGLGGVGLGSRAPEPGRLRSAVDRALGTLRGLASRRPADPADTGRAVAAAASAPPRAIPAASAPPPRNEQPAPAPDTPRPGAKPFPVIQPPATATLRSRTAQPLASDGSASEMEAMTVFGARRRDTEPSGFSRNGLLLSAALILVLGGVGVWAAFFLRDAPDPGTPATTGGQMSAPLPDLPVRTAPGAELAGLPADAPADTAPADEGPAQTPELAAADEVFADGLPEDLAFDAPDPATLGPFNIDEAIAEALDTPLDDSTAPEQAEALAEATDAAPVDPGPAGPGIDLPPRVDTSVPDAASLTAAAPDADAPPPLLTPEEFAALYDETGIWPIAPAPVALPPTAGLGDVARPEADQAAAAAAPAPPEAAAAVDDPPVALLPPPPPDTTFDTDETGLVQATPDGALTPAGMVVIAGPPPLDPPLRRALRPRHIVIEGDLPVPPEATPLPRPPGLGDQTSLQPDGDAPDLQVATAAEPGPGDPETGQLAALLPDAAVQASTEAEGPAQAAPVPEDAVQVAVAPADQAAAPLPDEAALALAVPDNAAPAAPAPQDAMARVVPMPRPAAPAPAGAEAAAEADLVTDGAEPEPEIEVRNASLVAAALPRPEPRPRPAGSLLAPDGTAPGVEDGAAPADSPTLPTVAPVPPPRPVELATRAAVVAVPDEMILSDSELAVAASLVPSQRPANIAALVARAAPPPAAAPAPAAQPAPTQASAVATPAPAIPTRASVAQQATQPRAINLRQVNLIGVFGTPSNRRALVRMANGRIVSVSVGDALDGGRVAAIGETELRYVKNGRNTVLRVGES